MTATAKQSTTVCRQLTDTQRTLDLADMKTPRPSRSPTFDYEDFDSTSTALGPRPHDDSESADECGTSTTTPQTSQRKGTGGLRVAQASAIGEDLSENQRQMQVDGRTFPKRRKVVSEKFVFQPSTLDKLIVGIWEQVSMRDGYCALEISV
jgi:ATP-dependent RNA helicase DDX49/DBP8